MKLNFYCGVTKESFYLDVSCFSLMLLTSGPVLLFSVPGSSRRYDVPCSYFYSNSCDYSFTAEIDDSKVYSKLYNVFFD